MKKIIIILFISLNFSGFSQLDMVGELMRGGVEDGQKLMKAYLMPYEKALGYTAVNQRFIYQDKQKSNDFKFSIELHINTILIPNKDLSFDVNTLGLERMEVVDANQHISPTVFGDAEKTIALKSKDQINLPFQPLQSVASFNTPTGIGFGALPIPELQFAFSYKNSQAIASGYFVSIKDVLIIGYNISLNSQISSYFNFSKDLPVQFEVEVGYGGSNQTVELDVKPDARVEFLAKGPYTNQEFKLVLNGYSLGFGANYRINKLVIFSKLHFQDFWSRTQVIGNYPVNIKDPTGTFGLNIKDISNPIDYSRSLYGIKFGLGCQYDFTELIYTKVMFSLASYNSIGIGFGVKL